MPETDSTLRSTLTASVATLFAPVNRVTLPG